MSRIYADAIPADVQVMLDNGVNFRDVEDLLTAYERLGEVEVFASHKGMANFVEIDWSYFYDYYETDAEGLGIAMSLNARYGIMNLIALQDEING
jgi:hypothetical protein